MPNENRLQVRTAGNDVETAEHTRNVPTYRPNVDILESESELTVLADLPGIQRSDIDIQFEKGMLTIYGKLREEEGERRNYLMQEYGVGDFYRSFQVNEAVDSNRISAEYEAGVLTLHLPKTEAARARKIRIRGE